MTLNIDKLKEYGYSEIVDLDKGLIKMCEIY